MQQKKARTILNYLFSIIVSFSMIGCSANLDDYQNTKPELKLEKFFKGKLKAYGMVQDRSGKVTRRFKADLTGSWKNNEGVLDETFYFDDGEIQKRVWKLTKHDDGSYSGSAGDVIGRAEGRHEGFAFHWNYTLAIDVDGSTWHISMDDWMYLLSQNRLMNRTEMTKWGFKVGELTIIIEKAS